LRIGTREEQRQQDEGKVGLVGDEVLGGIGEPEVESVLRWTGVWRSEVASGVGLSWTGGDRQLSLSASIYGRSLFLRGTFLAIHLGKIPDGNLLLDFPGIQS
jgi:hypothetical protein